jgi:hypothetical protein
MARFFSKNVQKAPLATSFPALRNSLLAPSRWSFGADGGLFLARREVLFPSPWNPFSVAISINLHGHSIDIARQS